MLVKRRVIMLKAFEVRKIARTCPVVDSNYEARERAPDAACRLNILGRRFWLTRNHHHAESLHVDSHGHHIRCQYHVEWLKRRYLLSCPLICGDSRHRNWIKRRFKLVKDLRY